MKLLKCKMVKIYKEICQKEFLNVRFKSIINVFLIGLLLPVSLLSQIHEANPANWLFPGGNPQGTRHVKIESQPQSLDSFRIKWTSPDISGDVIPLVGNIINNPKLFSSLRWAPNEIVSVIGDRIVVIDAKGKTHKRTEPIPYLKGISVLFDSLSVAIGTNVTDPVVIGLETLEFDSPRDSLSYAYLAGFDNDADTVKLLNRLAIDLRLYDPNIFASIKPFYGMRVGDNIEIYATVNMSQPSAPDPNPANPPYFRGFTRYNTGDVMFTFPLPDLADTPGLRVTLGPEVNVAQPSIITKWNGDHNIVLPNYPTPSMNVAIQNFINLGPTYAAVPYLFGYQFGNGTVEEMIFPIDILSTIPPSYTRPQVQPYFIELRDAGPGASDSLFILNAIQFKGIEGSNGKAILSLHYGEDSPRNFAGDPITEFNNPANPPLVGGNNHMWSVAIGDVDGAADNSWLPYYPNYPGNEIIVTQSSRDFAVAASRLYVLRYYSGPEIDKPSPPNTTLFPFDTICTQRINGWVAAVNDIDGGDDEKDEIVLVDGAKLRILRLKDYNTFDFRLGFPFDTVYSIEFPNQTISSVAISDLEGDQKNDLIVTTYDSLYVIGDILTGTLDVIFPEAARDTTESYCVGDTATIRWINYMRSHHGADIYFVPFLGDIPIGLPEIIVQNYPNDGDTVSYEYVVEGDKLGKEGKLVVVNSQYPTRVYDTTATVRFELSTLELDTIDVTEYTIGDEYTITGSALCIDSVSLEITYDTTGWKRLITEPVDENFEFSLSSEIECYPLFNCLSVDNDSLIYLRVVSDKDGYSDTSETIEFKVRPLPFPVVWDTCETNCPTLEFRWDSFGIDQECDDVSIAVSINNGRSFTEIANVNSSEDKYIWLIPMELPDDVLMRFCCVNSCVRTDTLISDIKPNYINIVSPNPFNPNFEEVEIVYQVPKETNVTLRIFDENNRLVAEPVNGAQRSPGIAYCDKWDGRRRDGSWADNGMYYLVLELSSGIREVHPIFVRK
jgi:hypothetical protein